MAGVRINVGRRSRASGDPVGVQVNLFGFTRLSAIVTGDRLEQIAIEAMQPSLEEARYNWPVLTGASIDTLRIETAEVGERKARVALTVGGQQLIEDERNTKHIDYAPFIELNGSPSGRGKDSIFNAIYGQDTRIRRDIHDAVSRLIQEATL